MSTPIADVTEPQPIQSPESRPEQPETRLRVLMAEDNPDDAALCLRELQQSGINVASVVVRTLEQFEQRLRSETYDIVLADYRLPGWTALDALEVLSRHGPDIPLIAVTGSMGDETAAELIRRGAADYILKDRLARLPVAVRRVINERALARQEREATEALRRSEANYRSLVQNAVVGIYRSSPAGRFLSVNPALVRMLGYESESELLSLELARDVYADTSGSRGRVVERYQGTGRLDGLETEWKRKDGKLITVRLSGRVVRPAATGQDCYEIIVQDVTEQRRLEAQLRQAQKMEAVGQLTGGIAHDLNNLLTAIMANVDLAMVPNAVEDHDGMMGYLQEVRGAAQRGSTLIRKLLGFSRREALTLTLVDMGTLVRDFASVLRSVIPKNIEFCLDIDGPVRAVRADPAAIEQILLNLVTNARDAMMSGGVLRITTEELKVDEAYQSEHEWCVKGDYVCLRVTDTGVGMDEEVKARIFEPFFTTKPMGIGTGLGLSMVYGLVKQHMGFVHVYTEPGRGTAVKVCLPVSSGRAQPTTAPVERKVLPRGTETILIAEDEPAIRRAASRALEQQGYRVLVAVDGEEALQVYRDAEPEIALVIADLVMPRLGGRQFYDALRGEGKRLRIILTSGYSADEVRDSVVLPPGSRFLQKPWTVVDLLTYVRESLDQPLPE